ncbi:MAG: DUF4965 domain-containing protein [Clostridia bacterium]|jgi:hypothetical protein|nr:DUF4965 domain-containing protein [Clostridia bacterium]
MKEVSDMRLPAYPLITCDPYFSIWSNTDRLYDSDTMLWCGIPKPIRGAVTVDGKALRFLGLSDLPALPQSGRDVAPYVTTYTFENEKVRLRVRFWTPLLLSDLHQLSLPVSFVDCVYEALDEQEHSVTVTLSLDEKLCYDGKAKSCVFYTHQAYGRPFAVMGQLKQKPLSASGDGVGADWGWYCILGGKVSAGHGISATRTLKPGRVSAFCLGFDEGLAIEYFGQKLPPFWREKWTDLRQAMAESYQNRGLLFDALQEQSEMILSDAAAFGKDYQLLLTAAARQILAAHKLVRSPEGKLLYLSKECHSNGCINTVDVSYPTAPFFLLYKPELVKAMLTGVFAFASMPLWKADYAPHDIGRYPHANGQVYALRPPYAFRPRNVYKHKSFSIFEPHFQMPVEECGNMLILAYAYARETGDTTQLEDNFTLLERWAGYLAAQGVQLKNQLCTDDFAGHSERNVNLAIKGTVGLACFAKIAELLGKPTKAMAEAKHLAFSLDSNRSADGTLPFSLADPEGWSLKYNLVWDRMYGFELFPEDLYFAESECYRRKCAPYGVPLDSRKGFGKSDWMLWAACLDGTDRNVRLFSKALVRFLAETNDRLPFCDWLETDEPKRRGFTHRSVQGGLWMPVLLRKTLAAEEDT